MKRYLILVFLTFLTGCAIQSAVLGDGQAINPNEAYVLIHPHYFACNGRLDLDLTRVDLATGEHQAEFYPAAVDDKLLILRVKPGIYFLNSIHGTNCPEPSYRFDWNLTLFEAKAGKLTYPGDWSVQKTVTSSLTEGSLGGGSAHVSYYVVTKAGPDPRINELFRQEFPKLSANLVPIYSKVQLPQACTSCGHSPASKDGGGASL